MPDEKSAEAGNDSTVAIEALRKENEALREAVREHEEACAALPEDWSIADVMTALRLRNERIKRLEMEIAAEFLHMAHGSLCLDTCELLEGKVLPELERTRHWDEGFVRGSARRRTAKYIEDKKKR